jgi:hypothetical protein
VKNKQGKAPLDVARGPQTVALIRRLMSGTPSQ